MNKTKIAKDLSISFHQNPKGVPHPVLIFEFQHQDGSSDSIAVLCRKAPDAEILPVLHQLDDAMNKLIAARIVN
jgi:hypothetical protein